VREGAERGQGEEEPSDVGAEFGLDAHGLAE
jgi:hypothetical protein